MEKEYLLYIGKSNNRFTHNKLYKYLGPKKFFLESSYEFQISVYTNSNNLITIKLEHDEYFDKNFKYITEKEYKNLIRKIKLKKLSK